jgi:KAP family P-loop domain
MNQNRHDSRQDRPIESEAANQLDRGPFVDSLVRALIIDDLDEKGEPVGPRATGYVVGLTGRWGLGKSSVLNLLNRKLGSMDDVIVALFNPWIDNRCRALRGPRSRQNTPPV